MGRTVPTFRQLIDDAIARWSKFRRALRREDQEYFDRLFRRVRSYTQAATYQASDNPMEAILLSIALDQEKRLDVLERTVQPPEPGSTFALNAPAQSGRESPPETGVGSTWSPPEKSLGSTWSPPRESLEQLDVARSPDEHEQPNADPRPDPGQQRNTGQHRNTTQWLDFGPLSEPARDEAVADRAEPKAPSSD